MTKVLDSQSDSIVVVRLQPEKAAEAGVQALYGTHDPKPDEEAKEPPKMYANVQFCNSKSLDLFGYDLVRSTMNTVEFNRAEMLLEKLRF